LPGTSHSATVSALWETTTTTAAISRPSVTRPARCPARHGPLSEKSPSTGRVATAAASVRPSHHAPSPPATDTLVSSSRDRRTGGENYTESCVQAASASTRPCSRQIEWCRRRCGRNVVEVLRIRQRPPPPPPRSAFIFHIDSHYRRQVKKDGN